MTETQRSFLTAGIVCAAAASVVLGITVRDRVDVGSSKLLGRPAVLKSPLMASRTLDTDIPESDYFAQMIQLLRREYFEPIESDMKLASGAVRGMVAELSDPRCLYFDAKQMKAYEDALAGKYQGIGADIVFQRQPLPTATNGQGENSAFIPRVVVAFVVPGGPADKAGVRAGDFADSIDGLWIVNQEILGRIRTTQKMVQEKKWPATKLQELQKELRAKSKNSISPLRARERLTMGSSGTTEVVWIRGTERVATRIAKGESRLPAVAVSKGAIRLRFAPGADKVLADTVRGKSAVTIDLRGNAIGDLGAMAKCLAAVGPSGEYGKLAREGSKPSRTLKVSSGNSRPPQLTILVNSQTRGVAEVFARALAAKGRAKLVGKPSGDAGIVEHYRLPDGSGYTLVTGRFEAGKGAKS